MAKKRSSSKKLLIALLIAASLGVIYYGLSHVSLNYYNSHASEVGSGLLTCSTDVSQHICNARGQSAICYQNCRAHVASQVAACNADCAKADADLAAYKAAANCSVNCGYGGYKNQQSLCNQSSDCPSGQVCSSFGFCVTGSTSRGSGTFGCNPACTGGEQCVGGTCTPPR